ncbi:unnamed protein product [Penicillium bialowiezense]
MSLSELPIELLTQIVSYLEYASDFCAFSQTHSFIYPLVQPRIAEFLENEDPPRALVDAAKIGSEASVRKLLKIGARFPEPFKPNIETAPGDPMAWAAKNGHVEIVKLFLEHGRDPHPLSGCYEDRKEAIPSNFSQWRPQPLLNPLCENPLMLAAREGHESVVKLLIKHGVKTQYNIGTFNEGWEHPLTWAVVKQHIPIMKLLIGNDLDSIERFSNRYNTPMHALAMTSPTSAHFDEMFDLLASVGNTHANRGGQKSAFELAMSRGNVKFIDLALRDDEINDVCPFDIADLLELVEESAQTHPEVASFLMGQFDVPQAMRHDDASRMKLFRAAASGGFEDLMKRLIEKYWYYPSDWDQHIPLLGLAARSGHIGMYKLLSEREDTNSFGPTNMPQSPESGVNPFTGGRPPNVPTPEDIPLIRALHRGHYEMVHFLVDEGFDGVLAVSEGPQLLFYGQTEILQELFDKGTAPPVEDIAFEDRALSISMAILGGEASLRALLNNGVVLDPEAHYHKRAFELAASLADVPILEIFLDAGFRSDMQRCGYMPDSVNLHCEDGLTLPLIYAAHANDRDKAEAAVDLLLRRGASINQPSGKGSCSALYATAAASMTYQIFFMHTKLKGRMLHFPDEARNSWSLGSLDHSKLQVQATELLLKKGADPLFWNQHGRSPLVVATIADNKEIVKLLLSSFDEQDVPFSEIERHLRAAGSIRDLPPKSRGYGSNGSVLDEAGDPLNPLEIDRELEHEQAVFPEFGHQHNEDDGSEDDEDEDEDESEDDDEDEYGYGDESTDEGSENGELEALGGPIGSGPNNGQPQNAGTQAKRDPERLIWQYYWPKIYPPPSK